MTTKPTFQHATVTAIVGLATGLGLASCIRETSVLRDDHCANQSGDAWCAERHEGERPLCVLGTCGPTLAQDGCVAERPADDACYSPCGNSMSITEDASCIPDEATGDASSTGDTDGSSDSSGTTGSSPCVVDDDCTGAAAPFCGLDGDCVDCGGLEPSMADGACESLDAATPVCGADGCVECTTGNTVLCDGDTPFCDDDTNTCTGCSEHAQCGDAACNMFTGVCLPAGAVVHVGGPTPDFIDIASAISNVPVSGQSTVIVHQGSYNAIVTVNGGRTIALLANAGDLPVWEPDVSDASQLNVGNGTVLVDGIQLSGNGSTENPAVTVSGGQAWFDRSRVINNFGGGLSAAAMAELVLRNCFIGNGTIGANGVTVDGSSAMVLYTSLGAGFDNFGDVFALECIDPMDVVVRNSFLVSLDDASSEISCPAAEVSYTASEQEILGTGNQMLGEVAVDWFINIDAGDFHLDNPPRQVATTALRQAGDPPVDIDGNPRVDLGSMGFAGADANR